MHSLALLLKAGLSGLHVIEYSRRCPDLQGLIDNSCRVCVEFINAYSVSTDWRDPLILKIMCRNERVFNLYSIYLWLNMYSVLLHTLIYIYFLFLSLLLLFLLAYFTILFISWQPSVFIHTVKQHFKWIYFFAVIHQLKFFFWH